MLRNAPLLGDLPTLDVGKASVYFSLEWAIVRHPQLNAPVSDLQSGPSRDKEGRTQWSFLVLMVVSKDGGCY